jgi:hypothetical protein
VQSKMTMRPQARFKTKSGDDKTQGGGCSQAERGIFWVVWGCLFKAEGNGRVGTTGTKIHNCFFIRLSRATTTDGFGSGWSRVSGQIAEDGQSPMPEAASRPGVVGVGLGIVSGANFGVLNCR